MLRFGEEGEAVCFDGDVCVAVDMVIVGKGCVFENIVVREMKVAERSFE
jgi:hypothetical protein